MKKLAQVLAMAAVSVVALAGNGALAATECHGALSGSVTGGVVVNAGDPCLLMGANVSGGVKVNNGGVLIACGSTINGGLVANGAANLLIGAGADEELPPVFFICPGNVIHGGVEISDTGPGVLSPAPSIALERDSISGAVHLTGNRGVIVISADIITGGLFCENNTFDPDDEGTPSIITGAIHCHFGP
jgi:hypothetical protein